MTPKSSLPHGRMPAISLLLTLGVALAGALLAPTAAAECAVDDSLNGVTIVAGGAGCTGHGHTADYADVSVGDQSVITYQGNGWQPAEIDVLGQPILA